MSQVATRTVGLAASLTQELSVVDWEIEQLTAYRNGVQHLLELIDGVRGKAAPVTTSRRLRAVGRPVSTPPVPDEPTEHATSPTPDEAPLLDEAPSTLEMARTVLRNAGAAMSLLAIRAAIRTTYGIDPAKTLDQMLYKRAQKNKGFYKTKEGEFGLSDGPQVPPASAAVMTSVAVPTTALA